MKKSMNSKKFIRKSLIKVKDSILLRKKKMNMKKIWKEHSKSKNQNKLLKVILKLLDHQLHLKVLEPTIRKFLILKIEMFRDPLPQKILFQKFKFLLKKQKKEIKLSKSKQLKKSFKRISSLKNQKKKKNNKLKLNLRKFNLRL